MTTLYGRKSIELLTLKDSLQRCSSRLESGIALLYSPACCEFARFENGKLIDADDREIDLCSVFEARVFNSTAELRWLQISEGTGQAAIISEDENLAELAEAIEPLQAIDTISQQYLLWGKGHPIATTPAATDSPNWSRLSEARIGTMFVPVRQLQAEQSVHLKAVEYLAAIDRYGNVAVVEERLVELKKAVKS